jgi:putative nucleotidyltransferase with HDIG domain
MASRNRRSISPERFQGARRSEKETPRERVRMIIQAAVERPPDPAMAEQVRALAGAVSKLWGKLGNKPAADAPEHHEHSHQVANLSLKIARLLGLREELAERLFRAGYLHDVGSAAVPESVFNKPGRLTADERLCLHVHPVIGRELLRAFLLTEDLAGIALTHHERFDGEGYPNGLKGTKIPLEARVLAIADSMDAMLSRRPYREPLTFSGALEELARGAGPQFDPSIVEDLIWKGRSIIWISNG